MQTPPYSYFSNRSQAETLATDISNPLRELNLMHLLDKGPFVDLGCGTGTLLEVLKERYPNSKLIGIDRYSECLKEAKNHVSEDTLLFRGYLRDLPFKDNSISIMFNNLSIFVALYSNFGEHQNIAREIYRTLKPGGVYMGTDAFAIRNDLLEAGLTIKDKGFGGWGAVFQKQ